MRFNLRLHGLTGDGKSCRADISVYARSADDLQKQSQKASETAVWHYTDPPHDDIPEGSQISVERVEKLN